MGPNQRDCAGAPIVARPYTLIRVTQGCTLTFVGVDQQLNVDVLLLPLQDNTGPTHTRALLAGSPAIGPGSTYPCYGLSSHIDQRGVPRPAGPGCDAGAYEGSLPAPLFGRNLIRNGDAEAAAGSPSGDIAGWPQWTLAAGGIPTVLPYDLADDWLQSTDPGPVSRGHNYFAGGQAAEATLLQTIDVSSAAAAINDGGVRYAFDGYLGGYAAQADHATATITFRNGADGITGSGKVGPVTSEDRGGQTGLLPRSLSGFVPAGTLTIEVALRLTRTAGGFNDGYADNLSLVLESYQLFLPLIQR